MLSDFIKKARVGCSYTWVPIIRNSTGGEVNLPVILLKGSKEGPTLYAGAAIHGDELNGIGVILKMLDLIKPKDLKGKALFVPVQNPIAFQHRQRFIPGDVYDTYAVDVHTAFPGSATGEITECIANAVLQVMLQADYAVDLHTGMSRGIYVHHSFAPVIKGNKHAGKASKLARAFGTPIVIEMESGVYGVQSMSHIVATRRGVPTIGVELGLGGCIDPDSVEVGYRGMMSVLAYLGMVDGEIIKNENQVIVEKIMYIRASTGGIIKHSVELGATVKKGDEVAKVYDLHLKEVETLKSPVAGIVYRQRTYPTINGSERVSAIAIPKE